MTTRDVALANLDVLKLYEHAFTGRTPCYASVARHIAHERGDHRGCFPDCDRAGKPCMACARVGCQGCDGEDESSSGEASP